MKRLLAVLGLTILFLAACDSSSQSGTNTDQNLSNTQLDRYQKNQPIPQSDYSQYRQTLIDVELAQIHGVATTTFFYNLGSNKPIKSCPSIGFPVASTSQLTNPLQPAGYNDNATIGQLEPNGTYTGDSSGTYVTCVGSNGLNYVDYWEGYVETEGGPAHFDSSTGQIILDGAPTVVTKTGQ